MVSKDAFLELTNESYTMQLSLILVLKSVVISIDFIAQGWKGNNVLSVLKLRQCNIDAKGTAQIARGLRRMTTLTAIDLSFNEFNATGMEMLGKY